MRFLPATPTGWPDTIEAVDEEHTAGGKRVDVANSAGRRPTLGDVARLARVSPATVSRVVNRHPGVREAKRRPVEQAIAALGYRPSFLGRGLAAGRTRTIAVLVSDIRNPFFPEIVYGVEEESRRHGYLPILCDSTGPS